MMFQVKQEALTPERLDPLTPERLDPRVTTAASSHEQLQVTSPEVWINECKMNNVFLGGGVDQNDLTTRHDIRDVLQHDMEIVFKKYGGPQQFLEAALTSPGEIDRFQSYLDGLHAEGTWDGTDLTAKGSTPFQAKISQLSFRADSSIKPPTFQKVALQLVDEFALNGFLSQSEPISVWLPKDNEETRFHLYYVKGAARSHTLQALLLYLLYTKRNLSSLPVLAASITNGVTVILTGFPR